jgi:hypothetical protein
MVSGGKCSPTYLVPPQWFVDQMLQLIGSIGRQEKHHMHNQSPVINKVSVSNVIASTHVCDLSFLEPFGGSDLVVNSCFNAL